MVFACQQDSFLKTFKTKVVACKAGKLDGIAAHELLLEDTVLFPEGGGQVRTTVLFVLYYNVTVKSHI